MTLDKIRNSSKSIFFKIFLLLIVASFLLWGLGDIFRGQGDYIAKIDNTPISYNEFEKAKYDARKRLSQMFGRTITDEEAKAFGFDTHILHNLINEKLIELEAKNLGIQVSNSLIAQLVKNDPAFQDNDNSFNKEKFDNILNHNHLTETQYFNLLKKEMQQNIMQDSLINTSLKNSLLAGYLYKYANEERVIDLYSLSLDKNIKVDITELELANSYEESKELYKTKEYRTIKYFIIDRNSSYTNSADEDKEKLLHDLSQTIEDELASGMNIEEVAAAHNFQINTISAVAEDGTFKADNATLPNIKDFLKTAFNMEENEDPLINPLSDGEGYYVIAINSVEPSRYRELEEIQDQLNERIIKNKLEEKSIELANKILDKLQAGEELESLKAEFKNEVDITVERQQKVNRNDNKLPRALVNNIYNLQENNFSASYKAPLEKVFFAKLIKINPAKQIDEKELETYKENVERESAQSMAEQYMNYLYKKYNVKVSDRL